MEYGFSRILLSHWLHCLWHWQHLASSRWFPHHPVLDAGPSARSPSTEILSPFSWPFWPGPVLHHWWEDCSIPVWLFCSLSLCYLSQHVAGPVPIWEILLKPILFCLGKGEAQPALRIVECKTHWPSYQIYYHFFTLKVGIRPMQKICMICRQHVLYNVRDRNLGCERYLMCTYLGLNWYYDRKDLILIFCVVWLTHK